MPRQMYGLVLAVALLAGGASPAAALGPPASPTPTGTQTDPGLILVVVVIPVVLVALIWMGYIFWLIFHEGENVGSGAPLPPGDRARRPSNGSPEPPDHPGNVG
ncbi:MAG: hypothetical protein OXG65_01050 [Chloroflexi bacterium]|nr:hypothetical protein [Chloroflexota bacterium]